MKRSNSLRLSALALMWLVICSEALPFDMFGLAAAVLPSSRSGQVGSPITVYATIANGNEEDATACGIELLSIIAADFSYQTTDPATNTPTGTPDTPVDIAAGGSQSFIITLTPIGEIVPTDVEFRFDCEGFFPAPTETGLNTLFMSASLTPIPDIFARAKTTNNEGIVDLPAASLGTGIFSIATTNAGTVDGDFLVFGETSDLYSSAELRVFLCESDPGTGLCIAPPADTVTTSMPAGSNHTFSAFVQATGDVGHSFRPHSDRVTVSFLDIDDGLVRGQTSVGVRFVPTSVLLASVLPTSRSVQVGDAATARASVVNVSSVDATGCSINPLTSVPAVFSYQTTDPETNAPTGTPDTPVDIAAGELQTFVFSFTPTTAFAPTTILLSFDCDNSGSATIVEGLDIFLLSASSTPVADIIAVATTSTDDGVVYIPGSGASNAFMVSAVNFGVTDTITVSADTGTVTLPLDLTICEWDDGTQSCLSPPASSVTSSIVAGASATPFAVFAAANSDIALDPIRNRIQVNFVDGGGVTRGGSSVAVTTSNDDFSNAAILSEPSGTVAASNVGATSEPGEPAHAGIFGGKSLWWQWTATADAPLSVDTFGSDFDTTLGIYTGVSVDALTEVASNDDSNNSAQSSVTFDAAAGTTYHFAVDGYWGRSGSILLNWGP